MQLEGRFRDRLFEGIWREDLCEVLRERVLPIAGEVLAQGGL